MKNSMFSKLVLLALVFPLVFSACEKNHFKSFVVGDTSGDGVQSSSAAIDCVHPGGTDAVKCEISLNEDTIPDIVFLHFDNQGTAETAVRMPAGMSLVVDDVKPLLNLIYPTKLAAGDELSDLNRWYTTSKNVKVLDLSDMGGGEEIILGVKWGTNTQRRYGWAKVRKNNDTDYSVVEWAWQEVPAKEE